MKVLIACEESQEVCKAFRAKGHEAYSADIQEPSGGHLEWHILGDVLPIIDGDCKFTTMDGVEHEIAGEWDLLIAHPPCTYLSNAGARHYSLKCNSAEKVSERIKKRESAMEFFMRFVKAKCHKIIIENPVGYANNHYRKPDQIIDPYHFAKSEDDLENYYQKRTCLWLKNVPPLERETILPKPKPLYICNGAKCKGKKIGWCEGISGIKGGQEARAKARSKTFPGIAKAMASQWG